MNLPSPGRSSAPTCSTGSTGPRWVASSSAYSSLLVRPTTIVMPNALLSPLAAQSFGRLESAARRLEAATGLLRDFSGCTDSEVDCARWARQGECQNNPGFMLTGCRASCASCESEACHNTHDSCRAWAEQGECSANTDFMLQTCPFACGVCGVNYKKECRREVSCATHLAFGPRS